MGVAERIQFLEGSTFAAVESGLRFNLIISNPPYIPSAEIETLAPEVRDYDPRSALDGGADGLDFFRGPWPRGCGFSKTGRQIDA